MMSPVARSPRRSRRAGAAALDGARPHLVLMSADAIDAAEVAAVGADAFLAKPFDPAALVALARQVLGEPDRDPG